ncbi:MAG: shikimate dehydrogenase [bacterium]
MIKLGLIGTPIKQSLSPIIHNTALESLGMIGSYELLETEPEDLIERLKYLKTQDYLGFNVTIPLKIPVTLFLQQVDDIADLAGAVNTVTISEDKFLYGYNTDVYGFVEGLPAFMRAELKQKKAAILGTGGVSRAVVIGLSQIGVSEVTFYSTDILKAKEICYFLTQKFPMMKFHVHNYASNINLSEYALIINTTPLGTFGQYCGVSPLDDNIMDTLDPQAIVYDLVYNPRQTELLNQARKRNLRTVEGIDMLIHQGVKAFEIWTGQKPPIDKIRTEVMKKL